MRYYLTFIILTISLSSCVFTQYQTLKNYRIEKCNNLSIQKKNDIDNLRIDINISKNRYKFNENIDLKISITNMTGKTICYPYPISSFDFWGWMFSDNNERLPLGSIISESDSYNKSKYSERQNRLLNPDERIVITIDDFIRTLKPYNAEYLIKPGNYRILLHYKAIGVVMDDTTMSTPASRINRNNLNVEEYLKKLYPCSDTLNLLLDK
jgi:hypothetical protein